MASNDNQRTRGKRSLDRWKRPLWGAGDSRRWVDRYLRLFVQFERDDDHTFQRGPEFFAALVDHLGDHRTCMSLGEVHPKAWALPLPWKRDTHSHSLRLTLSQFADPATWESICDANKDNYWTLSAHRGGGASRHLVWECHFGFGQCACSIRSGSLAHEPKPAVHDLICTFFRVACASATASCGYGEICTLAADGLTPETTDWAFHRWIARSLVEDAREEQHHRIPHADWITLLTPEQLKRLGGLDAVRASAMEISAADMLPFHSATHHPGANNYLSVEQIGDGAVVFLYPAHDAARIWETLYDSKRWIAVNRGGIGNYIWLTTLLRRADLLYSPPEDWIERYWEEQLLAHAARRRSDYVNAIKKAEGRQKHRTKRERPHIKPMLPPTCIRSPVTLDSCPPKRSLFGGDVACFRLHRPDGSTVAMTIHGVRCSEPNQVARTIFVGARDRNRCALHFDDRLHGWNGALSEQVPERALTGRLVGQLKCPTCEGRLFDVWALFEPCEESQLPDGVDSPQTQDFFTWFWLIARCAACKWADVVADIECA